MVAPQAVRRPGDEFPQRPGSCLTTRAPRPRGAGSAEGGENAPARPFGELGTRPVEFPGDHAGFLGDPTGFAEALRKTLTS